MTEIPKKPVEQTHKAYDYTECRDYIEAKYKINTRDYAGMFADGKCNDKVKYQDFWHSIIEGNDIHNGSYFYFSQDDYECFEHDWEKAIAKLFLDEFGGEKREIEFWISW